MYLFAVTMIILIITVTSEITYDIIIILLCTVLLFEK